MTPNQLPPLPAAAHRGPNGTGAYFDSFTAAQMHAYALAALAQQEPPVDRPIDPEVEVEAAWSVIGAEQGSPRSVAFRDGAHWQRGQDTKSRSDTSNQQAQEPVAWLYVDTVGERYLCFSRPTGGGTITNLYATPPAPQPAPVDERAEFEAWARPNGYDMRRNEVLGHYSSIDTLRSWTGWQARAALQSPAPPKERPVTSEALRHAAQNVLSELQRLNDSRQIHGMYWQRKHITELSAALSQPAPSPQAPGRRKGPPGITLEPQGHEQPAAPVVSDEQIRVVMSLLKADNFCFDQSWPIRFARAILDLRPADHPDTQRCIKARNDLNAALHGEGALIDDLEHAVANACAKLRRQAVGPMTEWEIADIFERWDNTSGASMSDFVRMVEAHRGITAKAEGGA